MFLSFFFPLCQAALENLDHLVCLFLDRKESVDSQDFLEEMVYLETEEMTVSIPPPHLIFYTKTVTAPYFDCSLHVYFL